MPEPGQYAAPQPQKPSVPNDELGHKFYLVNNVPYIGVLDQGHSQQAPAGFVQAAIDRSIRGAGLR